MLFEIQLMLFEICSFALLALLGSLFTGKLVLSLLIALMDIDVVKD